MSKKILTVLAPVAAIVAFMALPALAQATQAQCGAVECANGATLKGQSSNLKLATQGPTGEYTCTSSEVEGTLGSSQAETVEGSITKGVFSGCLANGHTADDSINAGAGAAAWTLKIQEPEASGQITAHLIPASGGSLKFTAQVQEFGFIVATCVFQSSGVQLMGTAQSDTLTVEGKEQFTLVERSGIGEGECGTVGTTKGDLSGSIQLETAGGSAVVVHGI